MSGDIEPTELDPGSDPRILESLESSATFAEELVFKVNGEVMPTGFVWTLADWTGDETYRKKSIQVASRWELEPVPGLVWYASDPVSRKGAAGTEFGVMVVDGLRSLDDVRAHWLNADAVTNYRPHLFQQGFAEGRKWARHFADAEELARLGAFHDEVVAEHKFFSKWLIVKTRTVSIRDCAECIADAIFGEDGDHLHAAHVIFGDGEDSYTLEYVHGFIKGSVSA